MRLLAVDLFRCVNNDLLDETAQAWLDRMLPKMMEGAGVTEDLKAHDQMAWVGLVNNCRARAHEIILSELIYS